MGAETMGAILLTKPASGHPTSLLPLLGRQPVDNIR